MTLTAALRAALAEPADLEPIRAIVAHVVTDPALARRALVSRLLLRGLAPNAPDTRRLGAHALPIMATLGSAGGDPGDLYTVIEEPAVAPEIPRSAEWTAAALRLAAWADGVAP